MATLDELRAAVSDIESEQRALHDQIGDQVPTDEQDTAWDALVARHTAATDDVTRAETRANERRSQIASLPARGGRTESGDGPRSAPNVNIRRDPFAIAETRGVGLSEREFRTQVVDSVLRANEGRDLGGKDNEAHFERVLKRHGGDQQWALAILERSRDEYESGFSKLMMGRGDLLTAEERTAMSSGSNTNGGYLIPTHLDPTIILTNSGSSNAIRSISRVVTLTEGTTWNGVTSAGVTASWDGELVEVSDDTPTFGRVSVATNVAQSFVQASIASFQDISGLQSDVMMMFADARDRLEGAAHATGSGSASQPKGIVTALDASTSVEVTSTTAATIGLVDLHALYRAVPVRWRGRGTWVMNPLYSLAVKALGTAVSASYTTDLTQGTAGALLGRPVVESDDMPTTQTTTALDNEIIFGDFSNYLIVDKPGSMSVEFIPHLFATANNLPDGRRGWYAYWRTGADSTNISAFRLLQDKTSA